MPVEMIEFDFSEIKTETDAAWLMIIDGEQLWLPKSQCEIISGDETGGEIEIPEWLATEKDMI